MKQCTYCGNEYPDAASACAFDGHPLRNVAAPIPAPPPAPITDRQQVVDAEHLKLLAIFHFIIAGLAVVGIVFLMLHYLILSTVFSDPNLWVSQKHAPPFPKDFFKLFIWFYIFMGFVLATAGTLNLLSGIFLRRRKHRIFSIIVGGLNGLQIPFGTILGIMTIIVLSRDSVRRIYGRV
jgi:hypothetical protein